MSRAGAIGGSVLAWLALFFALPMTIGARGSHVGWRDGRSGSWNRLGLVSVSAGTAGLLWCMVAHYRPGTTVKVSLTPEFLIGEGPYRFSRNPMYVCEQAIWEGWAMYFGSPALLASGAVLGGAMHYAVGREEKTLRNRFGSSWDEYANRVRRWL